MATAASRRATTGPIAWALAIVASCALASMPAQARPLEPTGVGEASQPGSFQAFVDRLWPDARARRISRATFDAAFAGVTPDPSVLERTRTQAEFRKTLPQYLAAAVSEKRVGAGQEKAKAWSSTLAKIEARYGVDRYVVLGVWGLESNYGDHAGDDSVIRSLATLAAAGYRGAYFRTELLKALAILQAGHIDAAHMLGSWAGAMGQTQFMPSNFEPYAVDFDGDGRRDIWTSVPDALASTANFLRKHGWVAGESWGYEVEAPASLGAGSARELPFADWAARGVRRADGGEMPETGRAALMRPTGPDGPAFLVTHNFKVIKSYNNATSYALGVALLGDRIAGWGPLKTPWPLTARLVGKRAS